MANSKQNIFTYATSELSQDAFIAWLCANYDSNRLAEVSKKFIGLLAGESDGDVAKISEVKVEKQHKCKDGAIDVLVLYKIDGKQKVLVIEDKTYTKEHDEQIIRYVTEIKEEYNTLPDDAFSCAYYKTGHIFNNPVDEDVNGTESEKEHLGKIGKKLKKELKIKSFQIFDVGVICRIFEDFKGDFSANDILQSYIHYAEKLKSDFESDKLPVSGDSDFELKENLDIWMNFYDSIYQELNNEFQDLKFPFFNWNGHYASIEVESRNFTAPRIEIRSNKLGILYFYYYERDEKKSKYRIKGTRNPEKEELFLEKYKAEYGSSVSVNNRKEPKQFFKLSNSDAKTTKEEFKSFIKKVAEFYQKAVNEIYSEAI